MPFEQFTETAKSYRPRISLRQNGSMGINFGAIRKFGLDKFDFAVLYYDRETRKIGIRPVKDDSLKGAHRINKYKKHAAISSGKFCEFFSIERSKTRRYDATWDEAEKMIILQL